MSNLVAIVKSLVGQVFAVSLDGLKRQIFEGERLLLGEQVLTGLGGAVTLQLTNGELINVGQSSNWQAPAEADAEERSQETELELEQALTAGLDPTLDLEAPAAGPGTGGGSGGAAGGGHSFVMLGETGLQLDPSIGFPTEGLSFASDTGDELVGALDNGNSVGTADSDAGTGTGTGGNSGGGTGQANRAPSALVDTFTLDEESSVAIDVLGNDSDLDGDTLSITQVDGQPITEGGTVIVSNGSVTLTGGQLVFAPDANYTGPVSFTYTVTDGLLSSSAAVSGSVTPINDAPIAVDDLLAATEDTAITYSAAQLLGNDSDVDGDTLTIASVTSGSGGTAVLNPDGSVTFTPNANFNGVADFTYVVTDGALTSNTATVTVNVAPANDAPIAVDDTLAATEDTASIYSAAQLLGNDSDVDGDTLTIASVTSGSGGTAVLNPDGSVTFTPNAHFNGVADFTYAVTDGALTSNTATVTVNVAPTNDAPVAANDTLAATEDTAITYSAADLLGNDSDVDGDTLTIASVTSGSGGTAVLNPDGSVTFTPNAHFNGVADFTYAVTDGALTSNTATVTVNVAPANDAPVAANDTLAATEDTAITYSAANLLGNDSDVDGDTLTIASVTSGSGGTAVLNPDGSVTFTPNTNFNGVADFTYTVTDGALTSNTATVTVNVAPVNDAPVAANDVVTPASIRSGLHADFYNYREGAVASGFDGPNMASISQAEAFIASSQANAIFVASSLSFTPTLTHLGSGTELESFLDSDSSSLVEINRLSTIDAVVHMRGQINLAAGTYDFRINADDGYIIRINGAVVASLDGTNTNNTTTHSSFSIATGGLQDLEIVYYDQGGFARFNAELRSNGVGPYEPVTDSMLSHSPVLYGGVETYSISAAELLANDSDPDTGDVLSITAVNGATGGTVSLSADFSTVTFVREAGFTGTPSFTYTATDTAGASSNAQVQINATSTLISGSGAADILIGDTDDNLIMGLAGNDTLTGAGGSDTFIWLKGHTGNDTVSDFDISIDPTQRDRIDLHDLLQGENEGNIDNYLQVVSTALETSLQISTNGQFNVGGSADLSITLENGGAPVDLSSFGATSAQIVNSLIAGADPLVKVDHS